MMTSTGDDRLDMAMEADQLAVKVEKLEAEVRRLRVLEEGQEPSRLDALEARVYDLEHSHHYIIETLREKAVRARRYPPSDEGA